MSYRPQDTWLRLITWLVIGLFIYALYGWKRSRLAGQGDASRSKPHMAILVVAIIALLPTLYWDYKVFFHH